MSTNATHVPAPPLEGPERHPFTGPMGQPIDDSLRSRLALLSPRQEAVYRLRRAIGTKEALSPAEIAKLTSMTVPEVRRAEAEAAAIVGRIRATATASRRARR